VGTTPIGGSAPIGDTRSVDAATFDPWGDLTAAG